MVRFEKLPKEIDWKYDQYGDKIYNTMYFKKGGREDVGRE